MRRDGLLRVSVKVQRHRPNRKIYSLTAEGRKLLVLWLSQPAKLPRMHHEFIHKLFQLGHVKAADRGELVEAYIKRCREWAVDLRRAEAMPEPSLEGPNAENAWFQFLSLRHLYRIVEMRSEFRAADRRGNSRLCQGQTQAFRRRAALAGKRGVCRANAVAHRPDVATVKHAAKRKG